MLKSHGFNEEDIWDIAAIARFLRAVEPYRERDRHAPQRRILHHGPELRRALATNEGPMTHAKRMIHLAIQAAAPGHPAGWRVPGGERQANEDVAHYQNVA